MKATSKVLFLTFVCWSQAWKLNVPRVLLPLADEGAKFQVYSEGGCFTWSSTRPEVVKALATKLTDDAANEVENRGSGPALIQDSSGNACTSAAIIQLAPRWGGAPALAKTQAVITAEDVHSDGHILRCDVIVDRIHRLQIVTKTLELFLEEAPEEFSVRGYDDQGNEFSTLEGIVFTWTVEASSNKGDNVKFIKFRDSTYALEPTLMGLEAKGLQGSKVLLEGVRTGSSKVSVRLSSKTYADVPPAEVTVMVVANLFLVPHFSFVMSGATIHYHAEQMRSNKIQRIDLQDSQQYFLEVTDDLAYNHPNEKNMIVAGGTLGETTVFLRDNNVGRDDAVKSPSADLHIVTPSYIMIDIDPHNNWNVIVGQDYNLYISVYDANNHKLFASSNLVAELEVEAGYFDVQQTTDNGTWISGQPTKVGSALVRAVLKGVKDVKTGQLIALEKPLKAKATLEILAPIELEPKVSYFPWDPTSLSVTQVKYKIPGHESTPFTWTSENKSVATVAQNGIAKTTSQLGVTSIVAAMTRASHNKGEAKIHVLPITALKVLNYDIRLEAPVGSDLVIPLQMWSGKNKFTQCDQISVRSSLDDKSVAVIIDNPADLENYLSPQTIQESCAYVTLQGLNLGFTKLTVSHQYQTEEGKVVKLSDSVTIGIFDPLTPIQPGLKTDLPDAESVAVLSIGSSLDVVWRGGPQPWVAMPENHYHSLSADGHWQYIQVKEKKQGVPLNFYVYTVTCNQVGSDMVVLDISNMRSESLPFPQEQISKIKIICSEPDRLQLTADPNRPEGPCPMLAKTGRVSALCYEDLKISVSVFDEKDYKFDNYSSLDISWAISDETLGTLQQETGVIYSTSDKEGFYKPLSNAFGYQMLKTKETPGSLDITATLKKSSYLMGRTTSDVLQLDLVTDAEINPSKLALFNHVDNSANLMINHGSGYFEVTNSESGIASHKFTASNRSVHVAPIFEGSAVIKVKDLCLNSKEVKSKANVNVIGVHQVLLKVVDQVQVSTEVMAQVELMDQFGDVIDVSQIQDKHLRVTVTSANKEIAVIEPAKRMTFVVKGAVLGHTSLTATATYGKQRVLSNAMPLHVFPALQLEPRNITLIIGAKFQVQVLGGPAKHSDSNIEFSIDNGKIANLDSSGLITASTLGSTRVTARAVKQGASKVVFSSDSIDVHVVKLHGVKIVAPITKMKLGTEMPLSMVGLDSMNQNAFAFGSAIPHLQVTWKLSHQDVATLRSPFWKNGIAVNDMNNGAMRLKSRKPGRTTVKVHAKITAPIDNIGQNQLDKDMEFTDEIEIIVFEDLSLKNPPIEHNTILMSPLSDHQLITNREGASGVKTTYSLIANDGNVISISKKGKINSKREVGSAIVLVQVSEDNTIIQELSVIVHVKPISYMMLNPLPVVQTTSALNTWPLGLKLPLGVSFHDESGVKFDAVDMTLPIHSRPSRFDTNLIKNANNSMSIELVQDQLTVLKTCYGSSHCDFLIFDVQPGILPSPKVIGVGDVLILESLVEGLSKKSGKWLAEPNGIIHVQSDQATALAHRPGHARISYIIDNEIQLGLNVEIVKAQKVAFNKWNPERHLTNDKTYLQAVKFKIISNDNEQEASNLHGHETSNFAKADNIPMVKSLVTCKAKFLDGKHDLKTIFNVDVGFLDGSYACLLNTLDDAPQFKDEIELTITPSSSGSGFESMTSDIIRLPFSSKIQLKSDSTIQLTNVDPQSELIIEGLQHVLNTITVSVSDPQYVYIGRAFGKSDESRAWPIGIKSAFWTEGKPGTQMKLTAHCPMTNQTYNMPIKVTFRGDQCANIELGWSSLLYFMATHYQSLLFIVASCVICVFVTKLVTQAATNKPTGSTTSTVKPNNVLNTPLMQHPRMQQNMNGSLLNSDSKPFLWTNNDSPVYGSPTSSISPYNRKSPRSLAQYSYSNQ